MKNTTLLILFLLTGITGLSQELVLSSVTARETYNEQGEEVLEVTFSGSGWSDMCSIELLVGSKQGASNLGSFVLSVGMRNRQLALMHSEGDWGPIENEEVTIKIPFSLTADKNKYLTALVRVKGEQRGSALYSAINDY